MMTFSLFVFIVVCFVLLRDSSHIIKFIHFLTSNFNFVHFAFFYFSRLQDRMNMTLVIRKKGSFKNVHCDEMRNKVS